MRVPYMGVGWLVINQSFHVVPTRFGGKCFSDGGKKAKCGWDLSLVDKDGKLQEFQRIKS